jgi:hypothetical protein
MTLAQKIQNFFFVTVIAVLVWFYAENENRKEHREPLSIQFVAAPGQELLISPEHAGSVTAQFKCTTGQYELFRRAQKAGIALEVRDDPNRRDRTQPLILRDLLNTFPALVAAGITIRETDPAAVQVRVERLVDKSMPVRVPPVTGDLQFASAPTLDTASVIVRMPESVAAVVGDLSLDATLDARTLAGVEENVQRTLSVPLSLGPGFWSAFEQATGGNAPRTSVTIKQPTAKVTLTIRKQSQSLTLSIVQILLTAPPSEVARFAVTLDPDQPVLANITVIGPAEVIERIGRKDKAARVWAQLSLSTEDLEQAADKGSRTAPLELVAPAGVRTEAPLPSARFTVTRQPTGAPPTIPPAGSALLPASPIAPSPTSTRPR